MTKKLVSVVVITYNSAEYVEETLDSVYSQSYQNIELIITDDASKDETINICKAWLDKNQARFVDSHLVKSETNTGIPANCNRGIKQANGEWFKLIAGDDLLDQNCILDYINYSNANKEANYIFSNMNSFRKRDGKKIDFQELKLNQQIYNSNSKRQYRHLVLNGNFVFAPTSFCNVKAINKIGLFDESIPLLEDYPMWLKVTKSGEKLFLLNKTTVSYRKHEASTFASSNTSNNYNLSLWIVFKKYMLKDAFKFHPIKAWHLLIQFWILTRRRDQRNLRKYAFIFSPYYYYLKLKQ